jgi:phospholipase/lecithinase/hemolysin
MITGGWRTRRVLGPIGIVLGLVLAGPVFAADPARRGANRADLGRLVVIGDSLSAGYQSGSLLDGQQPHGYAALVAAQADTELTLPLIAPPGIPNVLTLDPVLCAPDLVCPVGGTSPGRVDPFAQATNLAVPGATVQDALTTRPDFPVDTFTDLVLGLPGLLIGQVRSQVEWAEALAPTTILVWLGNNDALLPATLADASLLTPVPAFAAAYAEVMDRLAATGATLVVANIPDVSVIPFLTPAEAVIAEVAAQTGLPVATIQAVLGLGPGDFVIPDAFDEIPAILANPALGPLADTVVLDAGEVAEIRAAIAAYNGIIVGEAEAHGAAVVDIHRLTERIHARGYVVGGQRLTTAFLGGFFSLDGTHPTNTGYAVIANEFIRALNRRFEAGIRPVNVQQIRRDDPLVLPGVGHLAAARERVGRPAAASIRSLSAR